MANPNATRSHCWVTLLTKPSYIPGAVILAHSLDKHASSFPLVVQYTKSLGDEGIAVLESEARRSKRIIPFMVELLLPRKGHENVGAVAERFRDTFTKLRAFQVYEIGFSKACFLDADMAAFQNPDEIFEHTLPRRDWIAANHPCVCNLDRNEWAPDEWHKGNCAYTTLTSPDQIFQPIEDIVRPTYQLINGGMFLFHPSKQLWTDLMTYFHTNDNLKHYQFPDQDFLAEFFSGKRTVMSWKYNALKTMRYVHPALWSDTRVVFLHYIVDKPWDRAISPSGIAGHMGRDYDTHIWWWTLYEDWCNVQELSGAGTAADMHRLVRTQEPFDEYFPLPQCPGTLEDITLPTASHQ